MEEEAQQVRPVWKMGRIAELHLHLMGSGEARFLFVARAEQRYESLSTF